jgi:hypothetical protein
MPFFLRLQPATPEKLLKAFLTLDQDGKGYLTKEFLSKIMMEEGEPFTHEELDEMMAAAIDGETGNIPYEYYINHLMVKSELYLKCTLFSHNYFIQLRDQELAEIYKNKFYLL